MTKGTPDREKSTWERYAAIVICVAAAVAGVWLLMRYFAVVLMPFFLAWILSLLVSPVSKKIAKKTRIPEKFCAFVLLILSIALLIVLVILVLNRLFREAEELFRFLTEDSDTLRKLLDSALGFFTDLSQKIPFFSALEEMEGMEDVTAWIGEFANNALSELLSGISAQIPVLIGKFLYSTPGILLFLLTFLIASFYFCLDGNRLKNGILSVLPSRVRDRVSAFRERAVKLLYQYLRVYLVILFVTFSELFIGFLILGRKYAFLLALLISVVDILPVLGVGTVLCPWAAILFLTGEYHTAIGLLILWGVITLVRQVLEPRLVGDSLGLHPLAALVSIYAGLRLFGLFGMLLGPGIAVLIRLALRNGKTEQKGNQAERISRA